MIKINSLGDEFVVLVVKGVGKGKRVRVAGSGFTTRKDAENFARKIRRNGWYGVKKS